MNKLFNKTGKTNKLFTKTVGNARLFSKYIYNNNGGIIGNKDDKPKYNNLEKNKKY